MTDTLLLQQSLEGAGPPAAQQCDQDRWWRDLKRQQELKQVGFTVLQFSDEEILGDLSNVERVIEHGVRDHPPAPHC